MNGKINTPRTVCKAIVAVAVAAIALAAIIGCSSLGGGSRRQNIATVIQTAYDLGGREMHLRRSRQVPRRAKRGTLRSKVAKGCAAPSLGPTKLRLCPKALFLWAFRCGFAAAPQNALRFSADTPSRDTPA